MFSPTMMMMMMRRRRRRMRDFRGTRTKKAENQTEGGVDQQVSCRFAWKRDLDRMLSLV
jgi:hypothetical protein